MIEVKTTDELKQILLDDKEKFIGKIIIDANGLKYVVTKIDEAGIRSIPVDDLINMEEKKLQEYLENALPSDKIPDALKEVEFYKKDIAQLYG